MEALIREAHAPLPRGWHPGQPLPDKYDFKKIEYIPYRILPWRNSNLYIIPSKSGFHYGKSKARKVV